MRLFEIAISMFLAKWIALNCVEFATNVGYFVGKKITLLDAGLSLFQIETY